MAKNLLNKYVWLVETIYKAKKITFEEINQRWLDNDMSEDKPLPIRTFHKWRQAIEGLFDLIIENENCGQYRYYIQNADDLKNGSMRSWLFNTLTVSNLIMESASIKDKVLFEEIPDGEQFLPMILEALKKNQILNMTYQSYWRDEANTFEIEPYCLKAFKQRWYLVGRSPYYDKIMIYSLDRVHRLELTDHSFDYPKDFNAEDYFDDCFGIIADQKVKVETVKLKVAAGQAKYLNSLTLHGSQEEIERTDEYSIFTVRLRPTFDFQQEILSMGNDIEVLSPKWFREDTAERVKAMWDKYKEG
ncbi:WYL domain-containing protein [Xylanibacter ruminicola]|uniref:WYL domain-containing protein n=1 Tax=Xylanibacter ruminicola TaxID=839 RepID=A0A1H5UZC1_XYLRU|nr:WYL domain-containing protein [Xylanibacter ruminicola]SEF80363.1 WYL domain-containing protein [Xylanibacter ruminicola]